MQTIYWHDYETWGSDPIRDKPAQFAGVRTDMALNIIGKPQMWYCKPSLDLLPQPEACLITGITPQEAQQKGLLEYEFTANIHRELVTPDTCTAGYNSIRFDEEVTRHLLYRNFYDPYRREWENNNSRWDIIDMLRACYALRPEGIEWPQHENGRPSFKLEDLTKANQITHKSSHDALSDVYATIAIARLIKDRKPKLFDYLFALRKKQAVLDFLKRNDGKPVLHISRMYSAERGCAALVLPITMNRNNQNEIICYDLSVEPTPLIKLDVGEIKRRTFVSKDQLDVDRIPLKSIKINHCPVLCSAQLLDDDIAKRLKIDKKSCHEHYQQLAHINNLAEKLQDVFMIMDSGEKIDPEFALYSGGFINDIDREKMNKVRALSGAQLATTKIHFSDERLTTLLFRYRARNFSEYLTEQEKNEWLTFCYERLTNSSFGATITVEQYRDKIQMLRDQAELSAEKRMVVDQLSDYLTIALAQVTQVHH